MLSIHYISIMMRIFYIDWQQHWEWDRSMNIGANANGERMVSTKQPQVTEWGVRAQPRHEDGLPRGSKIFWRFWPSNSSSDIPVLEILEKKAQGIARHLGEFVPSRHVDVNRILSPPAPPAVSHLALPLWSGIIAHLTPGPAGSPVSCVAYKTHHGDSVSLIMSSSWPMGCSKTFFTLLIQWSPCCAPSAHLSCHHGACAKAHVTRAVHKHWAFPGQPHKQTLLEC